MVDWSVPLSQVLLLGLDVGDVGSSVFKPATAADCLWKAGNVYAACSASLGAGPQVTAEVFCQSIVQDWAYQ